jgi:hypothetical protein
MVRLGVECRAKVWHVWTDAPAAVRPSRLSHRESDLIAVMAALVVWADSPAFLRAAAASTSGFVEGQTFLGSVDVLTDSSGYANINATLPVVVGNGLHVDVTAADPAAPRLPAGRALD